MSEKFGLIGLATKQDQYLSGRTVMNCGEATAAEVDNEVMRILKESYEEAKRLLNENREVMDEIAEFLIEKETITGKEFMEIFRRCKGIPDPEEKKDKSGETGEDKETSEKDEPSGQTRATDEAAESSAQATAAEDNKNQTEEEKGKENTGIQDNTEGESGWESQNSQKDPKDTAGWTEVK